MLGELEGGAAKDQLSRTVFPGLLLLSLTMLTVKEFGPPPFANRIGKSTELSVEFELSVKGMASAEAP